ncbi:MAG: hypothetical protein ABI467_21855 [Kofleriaceae bacterium]
MNTMLVGWTSPVPLSGRVEPAIAVSASSATLKPVMLPLTAAALASP